MFDAYCTRHAGRVLLTTRRITRLDPTAAGIVAHFRCWCGEAGSVTFASRVGQPAPSDSEHPGPCRSEHKVRCGQVA